MNPQNLWENNIFSIAASTFCFSVDSLKKKHLLVSIWWVRCCIFQLWMIYAALTRLCIDVRSWGDLLMCPDSIRAHFRLKSLAFHRWPAGSVHAKTSHSWTSTPDLFTGTHLSCSWPHTSCSYFTHGSSKSLIKIFMSLTYMPAANIWACKTPSQPTCSIRIC